MVKICFQKITLTNILVRLAGLAGLAGLARLFRLAGLAMLVGVGVG